MKRFGQRGAHSFWLTIITLIAIAACSFVSAIAQENTVTASQAEATPTARVTAPAVVDATPEIITPSPAKPLAMASPSPFGTNSGGTTQLFFYLVALIGLFVGGMYFLRGGFAMRARGKGERKLQIAETRMLGNRQFLVVAEYEDRKMLIGVCPGRIDYLCTLAGAEPEFPNISPEKADV